MLTVALLATAACLVGWILRWRKAKRSPEQVLRDEYDRAYAKAARLGMNHAEIVDDWTFRLSLARVVRSASDAVIANPGEASEVIRRAIIHEVENQNLVDKARAKRIAAVLWELKPRELLTPEAWAAFQ